MGKKILLTTGRQKSSNLLERFTASLYGDTRFQTCRIGTVPEQGVTIRHVHKWVDGSVNVGEL